MDATISEQLDILLNANYKWKKQPMLCEHSKFHKCTCFGGYCSSKNKNSTFVTCCNNKATVGDYLKQRSKYMND